MEFFFTFCLMTGCRRNEALSVTSDDIMIDRGLIRVHGTKTDGSDRLIPILPALYPWLEKLPSGILFPFSSDHVTKRFKRFCPAHKLHDLRHTFATRCISDGVSMAMVQLWLGHSKIATTIDTYTHLPLDSFRVEAEKVTFPPKNPPKKD